MSKFCGSSGISGFILVIVLFSTTRVEGKFAHLDNSLDETRDEIGVNTELLNQINEHKYKDRSVPNVNVGKLGKLGKLESIPKPVLIDLESIQNNLPDLIHEGFRRAENVLKLENEAVKRNQNAGAKIARKKIFHSKRISKSDKIASACLGLGMLETSKLIAERFEVPKNQVNEILKSIKVPSSEVQTKSRVCLSRSGRPFMDVACDKNYPFRRHDGICNNILRKYDGAAGTAHKRYLPSVYEDGLSAMVGENRPSSQALPNARDLSNALSEVPVTPQSNTYTQMVKGFGQFLDHDLASTPETTATDGSELPCCENGADKTETTDCRPIEVQDNDEFYSNHGVKCLRFVRSLVADTGFSFSPREQVNSITSFVDASNVYGSSFDDALELRALVGGKMKENDLGEDGSCSSACNLPFLPEQNDPSDLFLAGDKRVNEQPGLTTFHTIFVRLHNILAEGLAVSFPTLSDEDIYQVVRRFVIAAMQHIVYNEFLPVVLSPQYAQAYGLLSFANGYLSAADYRECFNPTTANVFATAAYRFGHSLVGSTIKGAQEIPLSHCFFNNKFLKDDVDMFPSRIIQGEMTLASMSMDVSLVDDIRNKLFAEPSEETGLDLFALNIMRGRDHGLPSYNEWREFFGFSRFASFNELKAAGVMSNDAVDVFDANYASIDDLEIFPAGIAEIPVPGAVVGPIFLSIIGQQFQDLKYGDRFWYEGLAQPQYFPPVQLAAIRSTTLSAILCVTTDLTSVPANPFLLSTNGANPPVSCSSLIAGTIIDGFAGLFT